MGDGEYGRCSALIWALRSPNMGARVPFVRHGGESPPPLASPARPKCHDFRQHDLWTES